VSGERAQSLTLVVPLYMETPRLPRYFAQLVGFVADQPAGSELLFVDDGSTDGTGELVEKLVAESGDVRVRAITRPHRGKGAAVRAGIEGARGDVVGFCDVDLSTSLADLQTLVNVARDQDVLAIGSRDLPASRLIRPEGRVREFLGRSYNRAVQFALVPGILDTQCGAKAARAEVWERLLRESCEDGFAWDVEIIALARAFGITVQEIPVQWRHDPLTRVNVARDGIRMTAAIPRIRRRVRAARLRVTPDRARREAFDGATAQDLSDSDATHWWFRSKASFVTTALRRYPAPDGWLIDAGAGSAGVTSMLGWGSTRTLAVEGSADLAHHARTRYALRVARAAVASLPVADHSAAVVCLLDVIEHLDQPEVAIAEAARVLAPGGRLVVTVPAHAWLWSEMDEEIGHRRRYTRRLMRRTVEAQGLRVEYVSHVFSWLVAPVWLKRRAHASGKPEYGLDVTSSFVDRSALLLTRLERTSIGRVELPLGTSILCVATRP
jgi:dolichyl-phosphate beta-glucosyltransferase